MDPRIEAEVLAAMGARPRPEPPDAEPLPAAAYFDEETFEAELAGVFRRVWIPMAREAALGAPGDFATLELAGDAVAAVRRADGGLSVLHDVCLHRGARILRRRRGRVERLACPYHGFTYGLDGRLERLPCAETFSPRLRPGEARLASVPHARFGGWIWVRLAEEGPSLEEALGPELLDELANWPLAETAVVDELEEEHEFDWKIGVEAFLEPLHVPSIHPRSAYPVVDFTGMAVREMGHHSRMALPFRDPRAFEEDGVLGAAAREAGVSLFPRLNEAQRSAHFVYLVFPSTVWMLFPHHYLALSFLPVAPGRCRVRYELHAAPPSTDEARELVGSFAPGYRRLLAEDFENLPWIQRGVRDRSFAGVELGGYERRILAFRRSVRLHA